jgi:hypothetical protein
MRALLSASLGALALSACAGGAGHHAHGPAGIPYDCGDDRRARIAYEGGGYYPRGTAELSWEGRIIHLVATPPTYGLRYQEAGDARPILVWTAGAESASLIELAADFSEREIARCTRLREPGMAEPHGGEAPGHP